MKSQVAKTLLNEAARLVELTAMFQANYGRHYRLTRQSPEAAWTLHNDMLNTQSIIANLLDPDALTEARPDYGAWWERDDVMDVAMSQRMISLISQLMASTAHAEANAAIQRNIAGMLHPESYTVHSDPQPVQRQVV